MRVLVVEDDDDVTLLCRLALEGAGHEVVTARSGAAGIELAARAEPDLVVLDGMLPDVDGLEVLRHLAGNGTPAIPVVMASARVGRTDRLAALQGGADAYVLKPFEPESIVRLAEDLVRLDPEARAETRRRAIDAIDHDVHDLVPTVLDAPTVATAGTLSQILSLAFDAIVSVDEQQHIVGFNKGAEATFGYLAEEVLGKPLDVLIPERLVGAHHQHVVDFAGAGDRARLMGLQRNVRGRRRDGTEFPAEASITKLEVDGQTVLTAIVRDATERQATENELRNRARQQAAVAELGQRAVTMTDVGALLDEAASMLREVLEADFANVCTSQADGQLRMVAGSGWQAGTVGQLVFVPDRRSPSGLAVEIDGPVVFEDLERDSRFDCADVLDDHQVISGTCISLKGRSRALGTIGVYTRQRRAFTTDDIHVVQAFANVVASAIQREEDEGRIRAFLDAAPDATLVVDGDGRIVSANAQAEVLFGYSREELLRVGVDALVPDVARTQHGRHRARYAAERRSRAMGEGLELAARRKDGTEVPVDIMLRPLDTDEGPLVVAAVRDVTERRRNETVRDAFLHAVSHELRTPLTSVIGFSSLLVDRYGESLDADAFELAVRIRSSAGRLSRLLGDLLDLDRLSRGVLDAQRRAVAVAELVEHTLEGVSLGDRQVRVEVDPAELVAEVDPAQFERIVENLLVNAVRHTPNGTTIEVRVSRSMNGMLLVVEDDGPGVPADLRDAVFEPFRRNVDGGGIPGTGIGLSLVARFAELHGGRAWVEERGGGGASFRVVLGT